MNIDTIFYFVDTYDEYKDKLNNGLVSPYTIVFVGEQKAIYKGVDDTGEPIRFGTMSDDDVIEIVKRLIGNSLKVSDNKLDVDVDTLFSNPTQDLVNIIYSLVQEYVSHNAEQYKGDQGIQGIQGPLGELGERGPQGINGRDGRIATSMSVDTEGRKHTVTFYSNGITLGSIEVYDGKDGKDGEKGDQGEQGEKGDPGQPGQSGSSVSDEEIQRKVDAANQALQNLVDGLVEDVEELQRNQNSGSAADLNKIVDDVIDELNTNEWGEFYTHSGFYDKLGLYITDLNLIDQQTFGNLTNNVYTKGEMDIKIGLLTDDYTNKYASLNSAIEQLSIGTNSEGDPEKIEGIKAGVYNLLKADEAWSKMLAHMEWWSTEKPITLSVWAETDNKVSKNGNDIEALTRSYAAVSSRDTYSNALIQGTVNQNSAKTTVSSTFGEYEFDGDKPVYIQEDGHYVYESDDNGCAIPYTGIVLKYVDDDDNILTNPDDYVKLVDKEGNYKVDSSGAYIYKQKAFKIFYKVKEDDGDVDTEHYYFDGPVLQSQVSALGDIMSGHKDENTKNLQWVKNEVYDVKFIKNYGPDKIAYHRARKFHIKSLAGLVTSADMNDAIASVFAEMPDNNIKAAVNTYVNESNAISDLTAKYGDVEATISAIADGTGSTATIKADAIRLEGQTVADSISATDMTLSGDLTLLGRVQADNFLAGPGNQMNIKTTGNTISFCDGTTEKAKFVLEGSGLQLYIMDEDGKWRKINWDNWLQAEVEHIHKWETTGEYAIVQYGIDPYLYLENNYDAYNLFIGDISEEELKSIKNIISGRDRKIVFKYYTTYAEEIEYNSWYSTSTTIPIDPSKAYEGYYTYKNEANESLVKIETLSRVYSLLNVIYDDQSIDYELTTNTLERMGYSIVDDKNNAAIGSLYLGTTDQYYGSDTLVDPIYVVNFISHHKNGNMNGCILVNKSVYDRIQTN